VLIVAIRTGEDGFEKLDFTCSMEHEKKHTRGR